MTHVEGGSPPQRAPQLKTGIVVPFDRSPRLHRDLAVAALGNGVELPAEDSNDRMLTTKQAAEFLGISLKTLEKMRALDEGPHYHRLGRRTIRYTLSDLIAYRDARRH